VSTEQFKAPELSGENYDSKVDLYSAGIVLYFLCRYLKDKTRWRLEIAELRNGKRSVEHLYLKDDIKFCNLFSRLLKDDPKERPTAKEALELLQSRGVPKNFLLQEHGDRFWRRCTLDNPTLATLKAATETYTGIKSEVQVLWEEKIIGDATQLIRIESDQDVQDMFFEAEMRKARNLIVVSEKEYIQKLNTDTADVL
jgi:serine/threonine protein kinase